MTPFKRAGLLAGARTVRRMTHYQALDTARGEQFHEFFRHPLGHAILLEMSAEDDARRRAARRSSSAPDHRVRRTPHAVALRRGGPGVHPERLGNPFCHLFLFPCV